MRAGCEWVAGEAVSVRIAADPVAYAREVLSDGAQRVRDVEWDSGTHYSGPEEETVAYVITLDTVNFGSGYFPHLTKRPGLSGYFTVSVSLKELFERNGPLSARELQRLERPVVTELFGQQGAGPVSAELMSHFTMALNDLGDLLSERFSGSFTELVDSAAGSAERLVNTLAEMPYFRDVARYRNRDIPILKRAQITSSDLALALEGRGRGFFHDLDRLTIFADNLVPHVLRLDGVLEYSPELSERLERGELLPSGSDAEIEIRAVTLHAVERMVAGLRDEGVDIDARRLDLHLWNRGQAERYRGGSKHRTRTVFY